jgi:hypothetical protein
LIKRNEGVSYIVREVVFYVMVFVVGFLCCYAIVLNGQINALELAMENGDADLADKLNALSAKISVFFRALGG